MITYLLRTSDKEYSVTAVGTAAEALALAVNGAFDLYVLDLWLPGMDGMELCRRIRDRGIREPIMFFSAMVQPADRAYVKAAGADEYLVKPNDIEIFPATVERLLSDRRGDAAA